MSNLKTLRKSANLTQEALANTIGVNRTTLSMWETGANTPPTKYLLALAEALSCTVEDILRSD